MLVLVWQSLPNLRLVLLFTLCMLSYLGLVLFTLLLALPYLKLILFSCASCLTKVGNIHIIWDWSHSSTQTPIAWLTWTPGACLLTRGPGTSLPRLGLAFIHLELVGLTWGLVLFTWSKPWFK
jgi:hypothetical protein